MLLVKKMDEIKNVLGNLNKIDTEGKNTLKNTERIDYDVMEKKCKIDKEQKSNRYKKNLEEETRIDKS